MGKVEAANVVEDDQKLGGEPPVQFPPAEEEGAVPFPPKAEVEEPIPFPPNPEVEEAVPFPPKAPGGGGVPVPPTPSRGISWDSNLFDCHKNLTNAIMTAFFPCVTFGQIAEVLDEGQLTAPVGTFVYLLLMPAICSQWVMGSKYRKKLRDKYNLVEAPYGDVFSHIFCSCCSLCQEFRELEKWGLDPAKGWNGILAEQEMQKGYAHHATSAPDFQSMSK